MQALIFCPSFFSLDFFFQMMQNPEMQRQMEMMKNNPAYMKEMQVHYTATLCNTVHFYCILQQPTVTRCSSM